MLFTEFNDKVQAFMSDLNGHLAEVVEANEKPLIDINRAQLLKGEDAKGELLLPLRSLTYALEKKKKGGKAPTGIADLKDTGDFQGAMILEVDDRDYFITSTDEKTSDLVGKYGDIFGISKDNQPTAQSINDKKLAEIFKKAVGL